MKITSADRALLHPYSSEQSVITGTRRQASWFDMTKKVGEKQKFKFRVGKESEEVADAHKNKLAKLEAEIAAEGSSTSLPIDSERSEVTETLFATHGTSKKLALFWGIVVLSVILSKVPGAELFFTPLNQFATMVHEMSHAIMCVLTGGHVSGMTIVADGQGHGGLTMSQGGLSFLVVQAGYLGTALFGCFLVYLSQFHRLSKGILVGMGSIMGIASLFFIAPTLFSPIFVQALFSLLWGVAMSAVTIYLGIKLKDSKANLVVLFLAIYTAMDSLRSISVVLSASIFGSTAWSDATVMEHMFILPSIFWSFLWATLSVVLLGTTVWFTYGVGTIKKKLPSKSTSTKLITRDK